MFYELGLRKNWKQFSLLVLINAFVGGKAMVYPTFIAAVADLVHPQDRAESVGVYRLWRDGGYAIGAVLTGVIADAFNLSLAITVTGVISLISAGLIAVGMNKLNKPVKEKS